MRTEQRWRELFTALGFIVTVQPYHRPKVRLDRDCGGLVSFGEGDTLAEAMRGAAVGQNIDWNQTDNRLSEREWQRMAHL